MIKLRRNKKLRDSDKKPAKGVYILPNALTLCGLFLGFYAILSAINGKFIHAAWAIILANIFDGLDGLVARLTKTTTKFGIELDSLSDLVTFGVAPSILMYKFVLDDFGRIGFAVSFLFVACGALRLARFNVQTSIIKSFKGLPIPGAATMVAAIVIFYVEILNIQPEKNIFLLLLTALLSLLMVSTLKFHGLKEIDFKEKKPGWILLIFMFILFFIFIIPNIAIFTLVSLYVSWGIIENIIILIKQKRQTVEVQDEKNKDI
ncbi:MAG: CDP-diacylglycerol--serine O-phosphatidyltransferase [Thermodesulfovibrio sp.]|nr:CDP-diacylglycerol--serine O-phosphatidyltransferase [Thermodesulfovibrio sp.]MDW7999064.1 CDP-diacylglycerol--serine O-phosphatidyltransferase [Thermodesulfovibrio sp.]